jgi:hypothetical protein
MDRTMKVTAAIAFVVLVGCRGNREPPIVAGDGVTVTSEDGRRVVEIDQDRVPVVEGCAAGQVIVRTGDGWACASSPAVEYDARIAALERGVSERVVAAEREVERIASALATLRSDQAALAAQLAAAAAELDTRREQELSAPSSYGVAGCVPSPSSTARAAVHPDDSSVRLAARAVGEVELYCPVVAASPAVGWNRLTLLYADPDGAAAASRVRATLHAVDAAGRVSELAAIDSNAQAGAQTEEASAQLTHTFDFAARYYFIRVRLERKDSALEPRARGVRLWRS